MCYVACGRLDMYYEGETNDPLLCIELVSSSGRDTSQGPKPWDMGAAAVVVEEAGGTVADLQGGPLDICSGRVLAANSANMASQLTEILCPTQPSA